MLNNNEDNNVPSFLIARFHLKVIPVILAGGVGVQLWPRSREKKPKQSIHLIGEGTMIQNTIVRLLPMFELQEIHIITTQPLLHSLQEQLPMIPKGNFIIEPQAKNTAIALTFASIFLSKKYNDELILVSLPSDHLINNVGEFQNYLEIAIQTATEKNMLVTLGIEPTRAESSFGYIQITEKKYDLGDFYDKGVRYISNFAEKPDIATAQRFVDAGDFLWNSGIFVWKNSVFWNELEEHLPDVSSAFSPLFSIDNYDAFRDGIQYAYQVTRGISIDYGILEKSKNVLVISSTFGWSDVGTWDEVHRLSKKDVKNNVLEGDVVAINVSNCLVSTNGRMVSLVGVNDLIVVDTNDVLLICQRGDSASVKEVVDFLHRKNIHQFL